MGSHYGYGDRFKGVPRISSSVSRTVYAELINILDNIDFREPRFMTRAKRNRALGSAAALVLEQALSDADWVAKKLKPLMIDEGEHYTHLGYYADKYF